MSTSYLPPRPPPHVGENRDSGWQHNRQPRVVPLIPNNTGSPWTQSCSRNVGEDGSPRLPLKSRWRPKQPFLFPTPGGFTIHMSSRQTIPRSAHEGDPSTRTHLACLQRDSIFFTRRMVADPQHGPPRSALQRNPAKYRKSTTRAVNETRDHRSAVGDGPLPLLGQLDSWS